MLSVGNEEKILALDLSERMGIDEVESLVMVKKFKLEEKSWIEENIADELAVLSKSTLNYSTSTNRKAPSASNLELTLNQLTRYAQVEHQALVNLLTTLIFRKNNLTYSDPTEELEGLEEQVHENLLSNAVKARRVDFLCRDIIAELIESEEDYNIVKELFTGFAKAAHTPASFKFGKEMAKIQAIHWLKIQISFLEGLFQLAYYGMFFYDGQTCIALIQGIIGSNLGMMQANSRILEAQAPVETEYYMGKIEALLGMICLETLGTSQFARGALDPNNLWAERDDEPEERQGDQKSIYQSAESVQIVHDTLGAASPEATSRAAFPLILVAWAFILDILPAACRPPFPEPLNALGEEDEQMKKDRDEKNTYKAVIKVAVQEERGMLKGWKKILDGGLFWQEGKGLVEDEYVVHYKDTMNCELIPWSFPGKQCADTMDRAIV